MEQNGSPKNKQNGGPQGPSWIGLAQLVVVCGTLIVVVYILWGG